MNPVYLDHNSTTCIDEPVLQAMLPFLQGQYGNPSSRHSLGNKAREAVEFARTQVAKSVSCQPSQVIFTSGGTEANNLFIKGVASALSPSGIVVSAVEHPSVLKPAQFLKRLGWTLQEIPVSSAGELQVVDELKSAQLVSVMLANNETGVVSDIAAIASRVSRGWFHTDAVQAFGKIPLSFDSLGVHAMTISAHKINGPKGVGALVIDKRLPLNSLVAGGSQEMSLRGGTENVAGIVGFGAACERVHSKLEKMSEVDKLRLRLKNELDRMGAHFFGKGNLPNTIFFAFPFISGETLVIELDRAGYCVASGSACSKGETSHTLLAMGFDEELARGSVRVSLGVDNTAEQIEGFLQALSRILQRYKP